MTRIALKRCACCRAWMTPVIVVVVVVMVVLLLLLLFYFLIVIALIKSSNQSSSVMVEGSQVLKRSAIAELRAMIR